ncbi:glutamine synthetase [Rhodococcus sp. ABRD24]|uniref:glutamine synthetase family protein n=1 Tax=Rhodococcus sp. ABRD24 TaxID=2507582 RepID=UPI00103E283F|nr:glutamine synthetase family protein [Rhodococcus sp. ABRD24]QBJ96486.1 glutamine synthetase [Rhodococcus sp. ABRD24]
MPSRGFIENHGLWNENQRDEARNILARVQADGIRTVRVSTADPQGKLRTKAVTPAVFPSVLTDGLDFSSAQFNFDSGERFVRDPFEPASTASPHETTGLPGVILVPDPRTFRELPWSPGTAWILGDMYSADGRPVPFDARHKLEELLARMRGEGLEYVAGLEIEFYVTRVLDQKLAPEELGGQGRPPTPPIVEAVTRGYAYQSEEDHDRLDGFLAAVVDYGQRLKMPIRTVEIELGPGQIEVTFETMDGLAAADTAVLFRSMVKQVSARMGLHATFMAAPGLPGFCASGWHLHQSISDHTGRNLFAAPPGSNQHLAPMGLHFLGGILEHARAASVFTTPTVNGYRRRRAYSLAPDRATWGHDNRAAMCRVIGSPGDSSSRIENRVGEPAANPYLYIGSQIAAGLDGIRNRTDPGPRENAPYSATSRPRLPTTLMEAVDELRDSKFFRREFGDDYIEWLLTVKDSEIERFLEAEPQWEQHPDEVTDWEHREYFTRY